jgi:polysaccharide pyruvyl transferase WcaK-like protein
MLMEGKDRTIKCPYQTKAVVLDSRGQLLYCSPKSPVLGSTINISAKKIYIDNIDERKKIISRDCDHCIHDYHALPTTRDLLRQVDTLLWKKRLHPPSRPMFRRGIHQKPNGKSSPAKVNHALIVGWYGTETAGDKAILGEILHQLKQRHTTKITIASLNPYLTNWTVKELGYPNVEVIPTYSGDLLSTASQAEETIMGGGPLMDLVALGPVLKAFTTAKKSGNHTRIAGCGIGPLQERRYIEAVKQIILLADKIELRDSASVEWCKKHTGREDASCSGDPSLGFVKRWGKAQTDPPSQDRTLNCYLREWPPEYRGDLSLEQFSRLKEQFEEQLGSWINTLCKQYSLTPRLLAMHHFVVGGDDREFNRRFANQFLSHLNPIVEIKPFTVQDILTSMWKASLCITMRFHSTVFAHALNVPLLAIDYTNGGKIRAFLDDQNDLDLVFSTGQIAKGQWRGIAPRSFADEHNTDQHI